MALTVNPGTALRAAKDLNAANKALSGNYERLTSGLRINSAVDDGAGLALATRLSADAAVYAKGAENLNAGTSYLKVAQNAVSSLRDVLSSMQELAQKSASNVVNGPQRASLNEDLEALRDEYNRIVQDAEYNRTDIFTSTNNSIAVQSGYGYAAQVTANLTAAGFEFEGSGTFGSSTYNNTTGRNVALVAGDFNGDGVADLVTSDQSNTDINVFLANGDGTFGAATTFDSGDTNSFLTSGDYNGDGKLDLFTTDTAGGSVSVFLGDGDGTFQARQSTLIAGARQIVAEDLNSDGYDDLAIASQTGNAIYLFYGSSGGNFGTPVTAAAAGSGTYGLAVGDLNGDGRPDLVSASVTDNTLRSFLQDESGNFLANSNTALGSSGGAVHLDLSDLNNDGKLDAVYSGSGSSNVFVQLGQTGSSFAASSSYAVGGSSYFSAVGDFNGDGYADIVGTSSSEGSVSVLLNNGNGTFAARTAYDTGAASAFQNQAVTADFNDDGILDIAATNSNDNKVAVLIGNSTYHSATFRVEQLGALDVAHQGDAVTTARSIGTTKDKLLVIAGELDAGVSRFDFAENHATTLATQYTEASDKIMDVDIATEAQSLVQNQLREQGAQVVFQEGRSQVSSVVSSVISTTLAVNTKA